MIDCFSYLTPRWHLLYPAAWANLVAALAIGLLTVQATAQSPPLFETSVVGTDFDFIMADDPNAFLTSRFLVTDNVELPGADPDELFGDAFIFATTYEDGVTVEIWANVDIGSVAMAAPYAMALGNAIGRLPSIYRQSLSHVVVNPGDRLAFAQEAIGADLGFFVMTTGNIDLRISEANLEETVFHEANHVALEDFYSRNPLWTSAQNADPGFITDFAQELPFQEDIPESALFAFTVINYPGRLDAQQPGIEQAILGQIPNRIEFFRDEIEGFVLPVMPSVLAGDFDMDGDVDADDINFYSGNLDLLADGELAQLDLDNDGMVKLSDHDLHVTTLVQTSNGQTGALIGDVDLDGAVDVLGDAFALVGNLGTSVGGYENGDLNADLSINVLGDAFRLVGNLGQTNVPQ